MQVLTSSPLVAIPALPLQLPAARAGTAALLPAAFLRRLPRQAEDTAEEAATAAEAVQADMVSPRPTESLKAERKIPINGGCFGPC